MSASSRHASPCVHRSFQLRADFGSAWQVALSRILNVMNILFKLSSKLRFWHLTCLRITRVLTGTALLGSQPPVVTSSRCYCLGFGASATWFRKLSWKRRWAAAFWARWIGWTALTWRQRVSEMKTANYEAKNRPDKHDVLYDASGADDESMLLQRLWRAASVNSEYVRTSRWRATLTGRSMSKPMTNDSLWLAVLCHSSEPKTSSNK